MTKKIITNGEDGWYGNYFPIETHPESTTDVVYVMAIKRCWEEIKKYVPLDLTHRTVFFLIKHKPSSAAWEYGAVGWKTIPFGGPMPKKRFVVV